LCIDLMNRPDLAVVLAQDYAGRLAQVANILAASPQHTEWIAQIQDEIFELLKQQSREPDATASIFGSLGSLYHQRGELQTAIDHYRVAIKKDYDQVGWHYALARLLNEEGRTDEAIHEAKICLRLRPDYGSAKRMIEELSVSSTTVEEMSISKQ
jgi:tetratricopeptide (TPR) repeat protein